MSQHDYVIANQSGSAFRADLNNALAASVSTNSGSSAPSTTYAYMLWADTTNGVLKIRNSSNNAWIELLQLDGTLTMEDGAEATPGLAFRDDLNTGIWSSAADTFNISAGGTERLELGAATVFNESGADVDFRIEGDSEANLFYVDAGNDRIGIGTNSPSDLLTVSRGSGIPQITVENTSNSAREAAINIKGRHSNGTVRQLMLKYDDDDTFRIHTAGSIPIKFETADVVRVEVAEHLKINDGNLVIGTAGHGIDFSATSDATGQTHEILNDYEEGTWTPNYGSSSVPTSTYTHESGFYTKIGNLVTVTCRIEMSAATTNTGALTIGGFPFASSGSTTSEAGKVGGMDIIFQDNWYSSSSSGTAQVMFIMGGGVAYGYVYNGDGNTIGASSFYDIKRNVYWKGHYYV